MKAELILTPFDLEEIQIVLDEMEDGDFATEVHEKHITLSNGQLVRLVISLDNN